MQTLALLIMVVFLFLGGNDRTLSRVFELEKTTRAETVLFEDGSFIVRVANRGVSGCIPGMLCDDENHRGGDVLIEIFPGDHVHVHYYEECTPHPLLGCTPWIIIE